jgi:hypothetical protein
MQLGEFIASLYNTPGTGIALKTRPTQREMVFGLGTISARLIFQPQIHRLYRLNYRFHIILALFATLSWAALDRGLLSHRGALALCRAREALCQGE